MRLFIAINFNENIKYKLEDYITELKGYALKGNFTSTDNLHMTLVFLGEVRNVKAIEEILDNINLIKTKLYIEGTGTFKRRGGDIYWAGIRKNTEIENCYDDLCRRLSEAGFNIEKRPFRPHITLGREVILKSEPNVIFEEMSMEVNKISLMKSERINGKIKYTEIYEKVL